MINLRFTKASFLLILASAMLCSVVIKVNFIDVKELWLDEAYTFFLVSLPLYDMMHYIVHDVHPPLYYLFLKTWAAVFGYTPYSLRLFSLMLSCLVPIFAYLTARTMFKDRWNALLCFLLVLFSAQLFYYSVEVRAYMLPLLFLSIFFFSYAKLYEKPDSVLYYVLFAFMGACAFFSHYFTLFVIVPFYLHLLVFTWVDKLPIKKVAVSVVLFALLTAPWLPTLLQQWDLRNRVSIAMASARQNPETLNYGFSAKANSLPFFLNKTRRYLQNSAFGTFSAVDDHFLLKWLVRAMQLLFIGFIMFALVKRDRNAILIALVSLFYVFFVFLARKTLFVPRYFLFLSYFIPFFIGIAIHQMNASIRLRYVSVAMAGLIVLSFGIANVNISNRGFCQQYKAMVQFFEENYQTGDQIVFHNLLEEVPFDTYAKAIEFKPVKTGFPISIYQWWQSQPIKGWSGPIVQKNEMANFIEQLGRNPNNNRIWLITQRKVPYDPGRELLNELSRRYAQVKQYNAVQCDDNYFDQDFEIYSFQHQTSSHK